MDLQVLPELEGWWGYKDWDQVMRHCLLWNWDRDIPTELWLGGQERGRCYQDTQKTRYYAQTLTFGTSTFSQCSPILTSQKVKLGTCLARTCTSCEYVFVVNKKSLKPTTYFYLNEISRCVVVDIGIPETWTRVIDQTECRRGPLCHQSNYALMRFVQIQITCFYLFVWYWIVVQEVRCPGLYTSPAWPHQADFQRLIFLALQNLFVLLVDVLSIPQSKCRKCRKCRNLFKQVADDVWKSLGLSPYLDPTLFEFFVCTVFLASDWIAICQHASKHAICDILHISVFLQIAWN